jgi:hypothetical protein
MNKNILQGQVLILYVHSSCLLPDDSAGRIAKELWWIKQEFSHVNIIIPPWFSVLIYQQVSCPEVTQQIWLY